MSVNPSAVHRLADEVLRVQSLLDPLNATMLGVTGYDHRLPEPTDSAEERLRTDATAALRTAEELAAVATSAEDAVTVAVAAQQATAVIDRIDARMIDHAVTDFNYVGPAATLLTLMPVVVLSTAEKADAYLERLRRIPAYLDAVAERHRAGARAGRLPVRRLVDAAVAHLDRYLATLAADPLRGTTGPAATTRFATERDHLLATVVRPAFARYRGVLSQTIARYGRPDERPGLCWLPGGGTTYASLARVHTTTEQTPEELHQLGLELMERLRVEHAEISASVFGAADRREILQRLTTDPAMRWRDGEELLADARAAIARAEAEAPRWFGTLPVVRCDVRPVPPADAPGAPFAYYHQPALDGSRPGVYYANTEGARGHDRLRSEAVAFHEGVPGHHLQLTIAVERTELPLLRRLADVNAAIEGWALYAERLADEMGLYSNEFARLGMVAMDSVRAGRLVVDTGLHVMGWSRERAVTYLREHTLLTAAEIGKEVDRYIAYAGQALSYMVGRLEIQRIRAAAERRLGARFDIRAFHDLVMGECPLPLGVLNRVVSSWEGTIQS